MGVDVCDYNLGFWVVVDVGGVVEEAESNVACSTGDVEDAEGVGGGAGVEGADEVVFPEAVDAQGH